MRVALLCLLVALGCSQSKSGGSDKPSDAGSASPSTSLDQREPEPTDEPAAPSIADLSVPDGVPGLSQADIDQPRADKSVRLNRQALELHNGGRFDEAIALYKDALALDPGHVLARYNLSCAFNLNGNPQAGLALLKQFRDVGCELCRERLSRASEDAEWHDRWDDPRFVELVAVPAQPAAAAKWWLGDSPCPDKTRLRGSPPPEGDQVYCAKSSGSRNGRAVVWRDGVLAETGEYANGRRVGPWVMFGENGVLAETGSFKRGRREGPWTQWDPAGHQLSDGRYKSNKKHGTWTFFTADGRIDRKETWRNGREQ